MRSAGYLSDPRPTMAPGRRASKRRSGSWYALVALLLSIGWATPASGSAEELGDGSGLFEQVEPLAIRLEAPWRELWRRPEAGATRPGRLVYPSSTGEEVILDVNIKTRGKSRLEACRFPMLTLEFDADQIGGTIFADQRVVHLTVQCQEALVPAWAI